MTKSIDFSKLTLKDALDIAIFIEDEAEERYQEFAHQMEQHHTPETAAFFRFMAENEAGHGRELRKKRTALFGDAPVEVDVHELFDIEAPAYAEAQAFMSAREALAVAYRSEVKAYTFFDDALGEVEDPGVRQLFEELRAEEVEHQELVKKELHKLPPEPGFDPDDFVDEPVAQ